MSLAVSIPIIWQTAPNPLLKQPQIIWRRHHRPAPPLQLQLHKNAESYSSSFIRFPPEDNGSSKAFIARRSSKTGLFGNIAQQKREMNSVCVAAPLSITMHTGIQQSSRWAFYSILFYSILFYSLFRGYLLDAHLKYSCHSIHSPAFLWRPWLMTRKDAQSKCRRTKLACVSFFSTSAILMFRYNFHLLAIGMLLSSENTWYRFGTPLVLFIRLRVNST